MVAREFLEHAGLIVSEAQNGQQAVDAALNNRYDAVLMDVQMTGMDGLAATRIIRSHLCDLPIIAMTAAVLEQDREVCRAAGMNDHVAKPILPDVLLETLARWIEPAHPAALQASERQIDATAPIPLLPGFDLKPALVLLGGNRELLEKLLRQFGDQFGDASIELSQLLENGETARAAQLVHNIKGACGNLGAVELFDAAQRLEAALRHDDAGFDLSEFNRAMTSVLQRINGLIRKPYDEDGTLAGRCETCTWQHSTGLFLKLRGLLEGNDYVPHELLAELKASLRCQSMQQHLRQIEKLIGEFNYNQAMASIDRINCAMGYNLQGTEAS